MFLKSFFSYDILANLIKTYKKNTRTIQDNVLDGIYSFKYCIRLSYSQFYMGKS